MTESLSGRRGGRSRVLSPLEEAPIHGHVAVRRGRTIAVARVRSVGRAESGCGAVHRPMELLPGPLLAYHGEDPAQCRLVRLRPILTDFERFDILDRRSPLLAVPLLERSSDGWRDGALSTLAQPLLAFHYIFRYLIEIT